jgi:hypothetical protein
MNRVVLYDEVVSVLPGNLREWADGEPVPVSVAVVLHSSTRDQQVELLLTSKAAKELLRRLEREANGLGAKR